MLLLFCPDANAEEVKIRVLTLSEAVQEALAKNPEVTIAYQELDNAGLLEPMLLSITDPSLRLQAAFEDDHSPRLFPEIQGPFSKTSKMDLSLNEKLLTGTETRIFYQTQRLRSPSLFKPIDPSIDSRVGIKITQPILRDAWGRPDRLKRQTSRHELAGAQARYKETRQNVARRAALAYLRLYAAEQNKSIRETAIEDANLLRQKYQEKRKYGLVSASDVIQTEASMRLQEIESRLAQAEAQEAQRGLKELLVMDQDGLVVMANTLPSLPKASPSSLESWLELARTQRTNLLFARSAHESAKLKFQIQKLENLPQLSLFSSYASAALSGNFNQNVTDVFDFKNPFMVVGLEFQMPLGHKRERLLRMSAAGAQAVAEAALRREEERVNKEVWEARESLLLAQDRARLSQELLDFEEQKVKAAQEDFGRARVSTDLILRFHADVYRARSILVRAQFDEAAGWINLWCAAGVFEENLPLLGN